MTAWSAVDLQARGPLVALPLVFLLSLPIACSESPRSSDQRGLVLERVTVGSSLQRAGLLAGDALLTWSCEDRGRERSGTFDHEMVVRELEWEVVCPMPQTVVARRADEKIEVVVPIGNWGASYRPELSPVLEIEVDAASNSEHFDRLSAQAGEESSFAQAWLAGRAALLRAREAVGEPEEAQALGQLVSHRNDQASREGESRRRAWWHWQTGRELTGMRALEPAYRAYEQALEALAENDRKGPLGARIMVDVATAGARFGRIELARDLFAESLELYESVAPETWAHAAALNNAGNYLERGDQVEMHQRALGLRQRLASGSLSTALSLGNAGRVAWQSGALREAQQQLEEALSTLEDLGVGPPYTTGMRANLAHVATSRGDLALAEALWSQVIPEAEELAPRTFNHLDSLDGLATIRRRRGEQESAAALLREAVEIANELAPENPRTGALLASLGNVERERGNLDTADDLYQRAQSLLGSDLHALRLSTARLALQRGEIDQAQADLLEALSYDRQHRPGSRNEALTLLALGELRLEEGDYDAADRRLQSAHSILERQAPGSGGLASVQARLGRLRRAQNRTDEALFFYARALSTLEEQIERLGGTEETLAKFRHSRRSIYSEYIELLIEQGLDRRAFAALEAWQGYSLRLALATRDLELPAGDPSSANQAERDRLNDQYDRTLQLLERAESEESAARYRIELADLRANRRVLDQEIAPWRADLRGARAVDTADDVLSEARAALEGDSLGVVFSAGADKLRIFSLAAEGGLQRIDVGFDRERLQDLTRRFAILLSAGGSSLAGREGVQALGSQLYELLIRPLDDLRRGRDHLVLVLDGALHDVAFGALYDRETGQYLIEQTSISIAPSLTLASFLRQRAGASGDRFAGFGNPTAPSDASGRASSFRLFGRSEPAAPLPYAELETRAVGRLFSRADIFVGSDASETAFAGISPDTDYLHFATHAFVDPTSPLDSSIALAPTRSPRRTNGLLQAWEVLEDHRITARLVSLSACETARGPIVSGEGVLSLAWAFQIAGAQSVMASLWSVPDRSTSLVMQVFYRHLLAGESPSRALRKAQLAAIRGELEPAVGVMARMRRWLGGSSSEPVDSSAPFFWAGVQLYGADS